MTEVDVTQYPPYKMTDAEAAATVGRYQEHQKPTPAPNLAVTTHEFAVGRTPAAPPGVVYVGDVYEDRSGEEEIDPHVAAVAAYPEGVRSSVPNATHDVVEPEVGDVVDEPVDELVDEEAAPDEEEVAEEPIEEVPLEPAEPAPDYSTWTVSDLRNELGKRGIDYEFSARKADLIALVERSDA